MCSNWHALRWCMVSCTRSFWIKKTCCNLVVWWISAKHRSHTWPGIHERIPPRSNNAQQSLHPRQELPRTMVPLQPFEAMPSCTGAPFAPFAPWSVPWSTAATCRRGCRGSWEDSNSSCMSFEVKPKSCGKTWRTMSLLVVPNYANSVFNRQR